MSLAARLAILAMLARELLVVKEAKMGTPRDSKKISYSDQEHMHQMACKEDLAKLEGVVSMELLEKLIMLSNT